MSSSPLAPAEEQALARRAREGDQGARAALITSGMRSVVLRARLLGLRGEDMRDAVQSGAVGLIRAVDRFDPDRGVRLTTYAWRWIGAEMVRAPRREEPLGDTEASTQDSLPDDGDLLEGLGDEQARVLELRFGLVGEATPPMTRQAVAEHLGLTVSQVRTVEAKAMRQLRRRLAKVVDRAPHR
jgi:RNA polymerase sigma factor (sigma-70 family)